jgi:hypothetical protein
MIPKQLAIAALFVIACSSKHNDPVSPGSGTPAPKPPPVVIDSASANAEAGKAVAVKGTARDAKIAAAVLAGDLVVYCVGLDSWPNEVSGKPVTAHGTLEQTTEFAAKPGPNGEISAGTEGAVWVLRNCQYDTN